MSANETAGGAGGAGGAAAGGEGGGPGGPGGAAVAEGAGGPGGPYPGFGVPDEILVYWFDIALLCALGIFFLALVPRMIGRFRNLSEWGRGLILRRGTPQTRSTQTMAQNSKLHPVARSELFSDSSLTLGDANIPSYYGKEWGSKPVQGGDSASPTHVRSITTVFHPISKIFTLPTGPGKNLGKALITLAYVFGIVFMALNGNNPITGPLRLGHIAVSQIPVVIALGTKNNVVGMLLGIGYEKVQFLHQLVGTFTFFMANFHATGYLFTLILGQQFEVLSAPFVQYGMYAFYGVTALFLATIGPIRNNAYPLFVFMHITGSVIFFWGLWFHQLVTHNYILLAGCIYACDHLLRIIKTRFATAQLTAVPELGLTRIEVPAVGAGWRAGQHVRLRTLSGSMGLFGWTTAHPFTIASAGDSPDGKGMVLMVKKAGKWTNRLYRSCSSEAGEYGKEGGYNTQPTRQMKVIIEGPYGGVGNMVLSSYSSVFLVAGGSGITFALGAVEEIIHDVYTGKSNVKFIELVWSAQERGSLVPMMPTFASLLSAVQNIAGVTLRISVHYTRAIKPPTDGGKVDAMLDAHLATLAPNLTLQPGRPPIGKLVDSIARLTASVPDAKGLAVGVCGPGALAVETVKAERAVENTVRQGCGGIEVHQEVFGW